MTHEIVTRRRPSGIMGLRDEFDQLFNRLFEGWPASPEGTYMPVVDIAETDNEVIVKAELPGLKADDIDVSVRDNSLIISGEKKESTEERKENYYHVESRYGSFYRSLPLGTMVDPERIDAGFKDGILTIRLPKSEQAKPKKIKIKGE